MNENVITINGGYVVTYDDGTCDAVCAYEGAYESACKWADENNYELTHVQLVDGWDAADEYLLNAGIEF